MIELSNASPLAAVQAAQAGNIRVPRRWTHFVGSGEPTDTIRGRAMFSERAEWWPKEWFVTTRFFMPPEAEHDRYPPITTVVLQPCADGIVAGIQRIRDRGCNCCRVIVDVHADLWTPGDHLSGDGVIPWLNSGWMLPNLEKCIRAAAVVTTPHKLTVPVLLKMNPRVVIVPDTPTGGVTPELVKGWDDALMIARKVARV